MTVIGKRAEIDLESILFATDFSSAAEKAGLYVRLLAQRYGSTVHLIHVVDLSAAFQTPDAGISIDIFRKAGEDSLERAKAQLTSAKIHVQSTQCEGVNPAEEIVQNAKEKSVDLIVTGTRGQTGLARLAFGSMAEQLIHHAECPVLTVGPEVELPAREFRRIVYATDFSHEAAKAAIYALSFAHDSGAHIYLCHVLPETDHKHPVDGEGLIEKFTAALQSLVPDIAREWCEPECVLEHGGASDGILLLAHRVKADLIVLGARRMSHWFNILKAGIAFDVIGAAKCPVLTICG